MSSDKNVTVQENAELGRFEALDEAGVVAGFAEFERRDDGTYVFTHTEVDDAFEGQGIGSQLAAGALDVVRQSGAGVVAKCHFIASYMKRHPGYADLLVGE